MNTRLLFAAGRGARIEYRVQRYAKGWDEWQLSQDAALTPLNTWLEERIHPEDSELQYGPISTALRRDASARDTTWLGPGGETDHLCWCLLPDHEHFFCDNDETKIWLMLLIAEALADEGM